MIVPNFSNNKTLRGIIDLSVLNDKRPSFHHKILSNNQLAVGEVGSCIANYTDPMQSSRPLPFAIDLSAEIPRFRAETFWSKEPETLEWINRNLGNKSNVGLFIDVGANIGIYSLYGSVVNQGVSIISVEPFSANYLELEKNISLNNKQNQIVALEAALSSRSGKGNLRIADDRLGSSGAQIELNDVSSSAQTIVETRDRLVDSKNDLLSQTGGKVMLKIDTDGNELDELLGFCDSFGKGIIGTVLVETHPSNRREIESYLNSNGASGGLNLSGD
jgi:FkbM family methyltransferase